MRFRLAPDGAFLGAPLAGTWPSIRNGLSGIDRIRLILLMTLVLLLIPGGGPLQPVISATAALGIIWYRARADSLFWFTLAALRGGSHLAAGWYTVDNHQYLLTYWCLTVALALLAGTRADAEKLLRHNARLLIGLCFAFAAGWKFLSGEYLDGAFFRYSLLAAESFAHFTVLFGGDAAGVTANASRVASLAEIPDPAGVAVLWDHVPESRRLALGLSAWTILVELFIAGTFLLPVRRCIARLGDLALLGFIATTYLLAPVFVFGALLTVLGAARLDQDQVNWQGVYVATYLILPLPLFTLLGIPFFGFMATGVMLLLAYASWRFRGLLVGGFLGLGLAVGGMLAHPGWDPISLALGIGLSLGLLSVFDALLHRSTELLIKVLGIGLLLPVILVSGFHDPPKTAAAILALAMLAVTEVGERRDVDHGP